MNGGLGRVELQFTHDWVLQTDDFKNAKPVALEDWVDFTVTDEVLAEMGIDTSADLPSR